MKTKNVYKFLPVVLLMLFISCSKKEDAVNASYSADQYTGSWTESKVTADGADQTLTDPGSVLVLKSVSPSKIGLLLLFSPGPSVSATISGSGFNANEASILYGTQTLPDKSTTAVYVNNLTGSISNGKLVVKYTILYKTTGRTVDVVEVYTKV